MLVTVLVFHNNNLSGLHNKPLRVGTFAIPILRWGNRGLKKLSNSPTVVWMVGALIYYALLTTELSLKLTLCL